MITQTDGTLVMSDSSFVAKSEDQTNQDLGKQTEKINPSENDDLQVDAQVETPVNTQTDSSTLVTSDSSFVAKSDEQTGQDLGNNPSENADVKVDAQVETQVNTQTDSSNSVLSDSSFVAKSDDETDKALGKQTENINPLVMTSQKVNEQVEMQNTETDSTLVTSNSSFLAESEDQTDEELGKQAEEINSLKTDRKVDEQVEMQSTETDSTLVTSNSSFLAES